MENVKIRPWLKKTVRNFARPFFLSLLWRHVRWTTKRERGNSIYQEKDDDSLKRVVKRSCSKPKLFKTKKNVSGRKNLQGKQC